MALNVPQEYIFNSPQMINLFMGGTGSGKTYLGGVISSDFIFNYPNVYGFIGANTHEQLNTSTLKRIRDTWRDLHGWIEGKHYIVGRKPPSDFNTKTHNFDSYDSIISFRNGGVIYKGSLENYEMHSGKEFGWAILDESKDTREEAIKEVILHRLRQIGMFVNGKPINPMYILTTPAKVDWINDWFKLDEFEAEIMDVIYDKNNFFHKEYENKCVTICSIYHNKAHLPTNYIENLILEHTDRDGRLKQSGQRLIYANPFVKAGGEFYSSFDRTRHVQLTPFLDNEPVHITYDFNVAPYMTLTCWQIEFRDGVYYLRCFDEFCLPSPDNSSERVSLAFKRKWGDKLNAGLFYYGDPGGNQRDTRSRTTDFDYIRQVLRPYLNNMSDRVPAKAPDVLPRRDFANNVFDEKYNIRVQIDPGCKKTVADFEYVKEDANGKKLKATVKDQDTGQIYEKYGHTSDAFDYLLTEAFRGQYDRAYLTK
jgi:hypothetical protein